MDKGKFEPELQAGSVLKMSLQDNIIISIESFKAIGLRLKKSDIRFFRQSFVFFGQKMRDFESQSHSPGFA